METKKFKILKGESRSKGGFNNTKTTLSAAGISAIGGAAAGAAFAAAQKNEKPEEEVPEQEVVEQDQAQITPEEAQPAPEQPVVEQPEEPITEPQPVDNPQTETVSSSTGTSDATDDIPEEIAEAIIKDEIDNQDIDGETVISQIDGFSTAYGPDGSEVIVAIIHSPDGTEFLLADMDGDGVFSEIFTTDGEFVGSTETTITAGDLVEMADPSGGYLAMEENLEGADPTVDIVNIDGSEVDENENSMAQTETDDEVSAEELLAQITDSETDDEETGTLIDAEEDEEDDSDDDSDEDDENTDDDDE
jgi:hypothetical protein